MRKLQFQILTKTDAWNRQSSLIKKDYTEPKALVNETAGRINRRGNKFATMPQKKAEKNGDDLT